MDKFKPTLVIHLPSLLSAVGEKKPELMEMIGLGTFKIVSKGCLKNGSSLFAPSSIAVYGTTSGDDETPEVTACEPMTIYGCTKVYLELLGSYYKTKFGLDFRSIRYPGVFSAAKPGGGTTDYVTLMMYDALEKGSHTCYLKPNTYMPMVFEQDLVKGTVDFISAPKEKLTRTSYNITGFNCSPNTLYSEVRKFVPELDIKYAPDFRQNIADSWPNSIDDEAARRDWGWNPSFGFEDSVRETFKEVIKNTRKDITIEPQFKQQ